MDKTIEKMHLKWVTALKGVAILAVLIDHTDRLLYSNKIISLWSYFSVTVFVFLSGITSYYSSERHQKESISKEIGRKVKGIFFPYAVATCVYQLVINKKFVLLDYLFHLIKFDITLPFYFVVFYIQLIIISPCIFKILNCWKSKIAHGVIFVLGVMISMICIQYTYILDVGGGGKYLFGGSYLIVYLLGQLSAHYELPLCRNRSGFKVITAVASVIIFMSWLAFYGFELDYCINKPFGEGINPPGVTLMLYSGCIVCGGYYIFTYIETHKNTILKMVYDCFSYIGHYSLYIFLYHKLVLDYCLRSIEITNIWTKRVVWILVMVSIPIIIKKIIDKIYIKLK